MRGAAAHPGVAELLAAASAPARPEELAGELAAVAAFRREYRPVDRAAPPVPEPRGSVPRRPRRRRVALAGLAAVVALVGGTAYAAGSGRLPDPVQRQLHEALAGVGVPPPDPRDTPSPKQPSASASAPVPMGTAPGDAQLLGLCRAWQAARENPGAPQPRPDEKRILAEAAGGAHRIEQYCAALVATGPGATLAPPTPANPTPGTSAPGKPENPGGPGGPPATPPGQGNTRGKGEGPPG
jgi:hypothetical protein